MSRNSLSSVNCVAHKFIPISFVWKPYCSIFKNHKRKVENWKKNFRIWNLYLSCVITQIVWHISFIDFPSNEGVSTHSHRHSQRNPNDSESCIFNDRESIDMDFSQEHIIPKTQITSLFSIKIIYLIKKEHKMSNNTTNIFRLS